MGIWQSRTGEDNSSPQGSGDSSSGANINIRGDNCGNSGSHNKFSSDNITTIFNFWGGTNSSQNHTEILQCLFTSSYESHRGRVREPTEGTCTWVTEHPKYKDWSEKKKSGLLWLSADPGCGKSVTASFLITNLKIRTDATICYFFFKDDSDEQRSPTFALCALLHQLFAQRNSLSRYAEQAFKDKGKRFTEEVDTLWDILVTAVAEGGCGDVICVVDALDECEERTLTPLIRHITRLPGSQTFNVPLKFLVTSRPYHRIEVELSSPETTIRLKGEDELDSITSDVTRVIDEGIRSLESYWGRPQGLGYLRNLLESSADRTFLWVSLILDILKNSEDGSPEEFTTIVSTAPRDLAALYTKILDKTRYPDRARRILNIIVAAARPLTLREMNIAFRIMPEHSSVEDLGDLGSGIERTVKNLCGLFVRVIDSKFYLVHQTAREFLIRESSAGQGNWQHTLYLMDSNFIMANICFSYLSLKEFDNNPLSQDTYDKNVTLRGHEVDNYHEKCGFLDYAASHWADHFRDSEDRQMELFEFTRQICEAGSKRFLTWFKVYWFNNQPGYVCPADWTHLMTASWLGQGMVVERLLEEGVDIDARSEVYGTSLNIAAARGNMDITKGLLQRNVKAYFNNKEYNIVQTKRSELSWLAVFEVVDSFELEAVGFLLQFCIQDTPDPHGASSSSSSASMATD